MTALGMGLRHGRKVSADTFELWSDDGRTRAVLTRCDGEYLLRFTPPLSEGAAVFVSDGALDDPHRLPVELAEKVLTGDKILEIVF